MRILAIILLCALNSTAVAAPGSTETNYYFGKVQISSADGKVPYGETVSLVKRIIEPASDRITETVLQPPRNSEDKAKDIITTLTRIGTSNVFSAVDDLHSFTGELTFTGKEWAWSRWTYKIVLNDGSRLEGTGSLGSNGIRTAKTFYKPDGIPSILLKENLSTIPRQEYDVQRAKMLGL